jgi:hypothetical protein
MNLWTNMQRGTAYNHEDSGAKITGVSIVQLRLGINSPEGSQ